MPREWWGRTFMKRNRVSDNNAFTNERLTKSFYFECFHRIRSVFRSYRQRIRGTILTQRTEVNREEIVVGLVKGSQLRKRLRPAAPIKCLAQRPGRCCAISFPRSAPPIPHNSQPHYHLAPILLSLLFLSFSLRFFVRVSPNLSFLFLLSFLFCFYFHFYFFFHSYLLQTSFFFFNQGLLFFHLREETSCL